MKLNTFTNILSMSVLSLGLAEVAQADMKWVESLRGYCPTVCQENAADKYNKENAAYKFAVPSGIHSVTGKPYYICAVSYGRTGWRAGYNIEWGSHKCYAQWHRRDSGKNSYHERYFCLCANQQIPPITDEMVRR